MRYPPEDESKIAFVGMGPNQTAWKRGIQIAKRLNKGEDLAIDYCRRLAVTGAIGRKLSELGEFPFSIRFNGYARRNLNARWNGKNGKRDKFDREEGIERAHKLLKESFTHYVLLGAEVARCFGQSTTPLEYKFDSKIEKTFLSFPHPSGINSWWNDSFNEFRAKKRLREFLELKQ